MVGFGIALACRAKDGGTRTKQGQGRFGMRTEIGAGFGALSSALTLCVKGKSLVLWGFVGGFVEVFRLECRANRMIRGD